MQNMPEVLIVGRGFAGTLLAWNLVRRNIPVTITDPAPLQNATSVAAGIIIPVTGRRLAKTNLADVLLPFAFSTYREIEKLAGTGLYYEKDVLQVFSSKSNLNEWYARSGEPAMKEYCGEIISKEKMPEGVVNEDGGIVLKRSGYVDTRKLADITTQMLIENAAYLSEQFSHRDLKVEKDHALWKGKSFSHVIFCEGYRATQNHFFAHIPFRPAKGEILDFKSENLSDKYIISSSIYILPVGNGMFRAGATYEWKDLTESTTTEAYDYLEKNLRNTISCNFRITDHKAGIRPAMLDRRPCIGMHPEYKCLGMFNGLGTKGALMAPYYAEALAAIITENKLPDPEVSIRRFDRLYQAP